MFDACCSNFYFFAGNGAIDFIGSGLLYGFGNESLLGERDEGEGIVEIVLGSVGTSLERQFHLLKIIMNLDILFALQPLPP